MHNLFLCCCVLRWHIAVQYPNLTNKTVDFDSDGVQLIEDWRTAQVAKHSWVVSERLVSDG